MHISIDYMIIRSSNRNNKHYSSFICKANVLSTFSCIYDVHVSTFDDNDVSDIENELNVDCDTIEFNDNELLSNGQNDEDENQMTSSIHS